MLTFKKMQQDATQDTYAKRKTPTNTDSYKVIEIVYPSMSLKVMNFLHGKRSLRIDQKI